jgi:hypothetical protein
MMLVAGGPAQPTTDALMPLDSDDSDTEIGGVNPGPPPGAADSSLISDTPAHWV